MGMNEQELLIPADVAEQYQQEVENLTREEDFIEAAMKKTAKIIDEPFRPRNRAERRAWEKELKKKNKNKRVFADNLRQAVERLAYTEMIQRVRKMNEEFEKEGAEENEAAN